MVISQFCSDQAVNSLLNYSKMMVDKLCSNYDRPKELKNIQYLIFAGLVSYYGFEHIEEITASFTKNKFIYTKDTIANFLAKSNSVSKETLDITSFEQSCALLYTEYFYRKSKNEYFSTGQIIVSDNKHYDPDKLLEFTVHEVNHSVNSINNGIISFGSSFKSRIGMYTRDYNTNVRKRMILEESINVLQAAEIMDHILAFSQYDVEDRDIKYELDKIRYAAGKKREGQGYILTTPIIRPLYEDAKFNKILKERRIDGNVNPIVSQFDAKVGNNSFDALASICDDIYVPSISNWAVLKKQNKAQDIVKKYVRH